MNNLKKTIGKKLRAKREEKGFSTQASFAKAIDADQSRVSRWETGDNVPDSSYRARINEVLGVTDDYWFSDLTTAPPPKVTSLLEVIKNQEQEIAELRELALKLSQAHENPHPHIPQDILERLPKDPHDPIWELLRAQFGIDCDPYGEGLGKVKK